MKEAVSPAELTTWSFNINVLSSALQSMEIVDAEMIALLLCNSPFALVRSLYVRFVGYYWRNVKIEWPKWPDVIMTWQSLDLRFSIDTHQAYSLKKGSPSLQAFLSSSFQLTSNYKLLLFEIRWNVSHVCFCLWENPGSISLNASLLHGQESWHYPLSIRIVKFPNLVSQIRWNVWHFARKSVDRCVVCIQASPRDRLFKMSLPNFSHFGRNGHFRFEKTENETQFSVFKRHMQLP